MVEREDALKFNENTEGKIEMISRVPLDTTERL